MAAYRKNWPLSRVLEGDPAREKSRFLNGSPGGAADYFSRVKRYNADLYRPTDTAPKAAEVPYFAPATRTAGMNLGGGYETGDVNAIASRYGGTPYSAFAGGTSGTIPRFNTTPPTRRPLGAAGDAGSAGMETQPGTVHDQPPMPRGAPTTEGSEGVKPPEGNAMQRWTEKGGTAHTFNKANVERGVRPKIDARARPDPKASTASDDIRQKWGWGSDPMSLPY